MKLTGALCACCVLALNGARVRSAEAEGLAGAIRAWAANDVISIRIIAISTETDSRAGLSVAEFEEAVARGPDYRLEIADAPEARAIGGLLIDYPLERGAVNLVADVRQRIELLVGQQVALTIYLGMAGDLVWGEETWRQKRGRRFMRRLTAYLGDRM
ncbi:MAG TPA: hypothetical protein VJS92_18405 [Candidatus Polarisedimenticolaceae bacterium]|nr:hypothetical protein [Candidatus Polarisedimenticolaceae bacterium]